LVCYLVLQRLLPNLGQEISDMKEELATQNSKFAKIETEMMAIRGDLLGLRSENENMQKNFQSVTTVREKLDRFLLKQDEFSSTMEAHGNESLRFRNRLSNLEAEVEKLADAFKSGIMLAQDLGTSEETASAVESTLFLAVKKKLESKDTGERFDGVYEVLDNRMKEALPLLLPLIEDPDQFVQVGAIETVGEFLYMEALPTLIKVLRDPDVTVRAEALRQLIRMTGQSDLEFDVRNAEVERDKVVKKWEKWLKSRK
ncbi:MAG: HEAT repeat domain-containing protein, partial [Planctomycetota bacterium]